MNNHPFVTAALARAHVRELHEEARQDRLVHRARRARRAARARDRG